MHRASFQLPDLSDLADAGDYTQKRMSDAQTWRAAVIIPMDDGIVTVQHRRGESVYWLPPGGMVEPGETMPEAGAREVEEETGLKVRVTRLLYIREPESKPGTLEFFMLGERLDGDPAYRDNPHDDAHLEDVGVLSFERIESDDDLTFYPVAIRQRLREDIQNQPDNAVYLGKRA
jgi:8-oxo-dGTP pyrophosphatase MutT (NUDIX family)